MTSSRSHRKWWRQNLNPVCTLLLHEHATSVKAGIPRTLKISSWDRNWVTGGCWVTWLMPGVQEIFISSNSKKASELPGSTFGHGSSCETKRAFVETQRGL